MTPYRPAFSSSWVRLAGALTLAAAAVAVAAPKTMRAVRVHGTALQLDMIPVPSPGPGEVRIRVYAAGVNPFERPRPNPPPGVHWDPNVPRMVGGDVAGVVDELGMGVSGWKVGDKVITAMQQAPEVNGAPQGSYAEYVIARASDIARKSSKMTFEQAAGVPTVALTAWRELVVRAHVHAGQKVLIQGGAGGVGSAAVQIAKALGATVIATASPNNDDYLKSIGASQVIDYNSTKFEDVVHDADIVLDTVGGDTAARSPATLRPGGIYLSVASRDNPPECTQGKISCPPPAPRSADTVGPWLTEVGKLIDAGQYQTNVFKVFPLQQAAAAQALNAEHHTRGKIVLSVRAGSERR